MQTQNLNELIEFNDARFNPKVLINETGYRMVLLSMRAGQSVPEHATPGKVTVYVIQGHITFYEGDLPCELHTGGAVTVEPNSKHRVTAHKDSALLVLATGIAAPNDAPVDKYEVIDLREVPHPERHSLIFARFDSLAIGNSLQLLNDHDPVPLNRQLESMRPGQASWEYILRGPSLFRIRIRRTAPPHALEMPSQTVSQREPAHNPLKISPQH